MWAHAQLRDSLDGHTTPFASCVAGCNAWPAAMHSVQGSSGVGQKPVGPMAPFSPACSPLMLRSNTPPPRCLFTFSARQRACEEDSGQDVGQTGSSSSTRLGCARPRLCCWPR